MAPVTLHGKIPKMTAEAFGDIETVVVNGTTLAYRQAGHGEPVVLLHGDISDLRTWEHQLGPLSAATGWSRKAAASSDPMTGDRQVTTTGGRGTSMTCWRSSTPSTPLPRTSSATRPARTSACWRRSESRAPSARWCSEPPVTLVHADPTPPRRRDEIDAAQAPDCARHDAVRCHGHAPGQLAFRRGNDDQGLRVFARGVLGDRDFYDRRSATRLEQIKDNVVPIKMQMLVGRLPPLAEADLRDMRARTPIVTGQHTAPSMLPLMDRLEELLPDVERVTTANASHFMHKDDPAALNRVVLDVLGRHCGSG